MKKLNINLKRKTLCMVLSIILVSIFTLTIVYAALSTTLSITGSGTVNASSWDISISNSESSYYVNSSTGSASFTTPTITGTTIANYSVSLTKPGDSVTLYFKINNNGTLNGEISSIVNSTPTCTSSTGNTTDESLICDNLNISLNYYFDDDKISIGDIISTDNKICRKSGDSLSTSFLKLVISLDNAMTSVPSSNVTISNLSHEIIYAQTDKTCNSSINEPT